MPEVRGALPGRCARAIIVKQNGGKGMPKRTFKDRLTIGLGAEQIDLHYFGPAHTGGDAFVVFIAARVMHVGDTMPTRDMRRALVCLQHDDPRARLERRIWSDVMTEARRQHGYRPDMIRVREAL